MSRVPSRLTLPLQLQQLDRAAADGRRYQVTDLSARVSQSGFDAARARVQAAAAQAEAAAAQQSANAANGAAGSAQAAANNANQAAANASGAAIAAQNSANHANQRAATLELTRVWIADPQAVDVFAPSSWGGMPDMFVQADFGPFPCVVTFSCEITGDAQIRLYHNGVERNFTFRASGGLRSCMGFVDVLVPGNGSLSVGWQGSGRSAAKRRQLSVHRIATP